MDDLLRGLIVGVALAAPVGPVGLICIRLALTQGQGPAISAGMGAAVADAIFGAIGGLGLTLIQSFITNNEVVLGSISGLILVVLGTATMRQSVSAEEKPLTLDSMVRDFATTFSLAITNPATFVAALGLFAALGSVNPVQNPTGAVVLVSSVFAGSALWWICLAHIATVFRRHVQDNLVWINRISGALFMAFGVAILINAVTQN